MLVTACLPCCTETAGAGQEECRQEDRALPESDRKLRLSLNSRVRLTLNQPRQCRLMLLSMMHSF